MCGIAGVAGASATERTALAMVSLMSYRGPDGLGAYAEPEIALASCRLAIVDPAGSQQPLKNARGDLVLVFNGEVYNFRELRAEVSAHGRRSLTDGDAETVLLAREEWGDDYLSHIEGMFAFALWDGPAKELRLARDRFGEKPLCYSWDGQTLAFASEAKALLAAGFGSREPDPEAIHHYLSFRAVPAPLTLFRGIRQIPPGCELILSKGRISERRYYEPRREELARSDGEWADGLRDHMRRAVRQRLVSDVPLGALLSGGLDSTAVVALMAEVGRPRTFFIGFDQGERTKVDRRFARLAAERLGTDHAELQMGSGDLLREMPKIMWHLENPSVDGYQYFYAYRLARRGVTVVLSGQGGDELFAGYGWFRQIKAAERWRQLALHLPRRPARLGASFLCGTLRGLGKGRGASRVATLLTGSTLADSYALVKHLLLHDEKQAIYSPAFRGLLEHASTSEALVAKEVERFADWPITEAVSRLQMAPISATYSCATRMR